MESLQVTGSFREPPCKQAHGLTPTGWVHTKDGKPCKHMNAAHAQFARRIVPPTRQEPTTVTFEEFVDALRGGDPAGFLFGRIEAHFYGVPGGSSR